jgi:hypothetical protein
MSSKALRAFLDFQATVAVKLTTHRHFSQSKRFAELDRHKTLVAGYIDRRRHDVL